NERNDRASRTPHTHPAALDEMRSQTVDRRDSQERAALNSTWQQQVGRIGAGGGNRTLTGSEPHGILSPARLPISPLRPASELPVYRQAPAPHADGSAPGLQVGDKTPLPRSLMPEHQAAIPPPSSV